MDNHPIPQDVTHFQFKLIGNLTLKQFGYVGAGGISAWIAISTGAPLFVKLLLAVIFAGGGLIFAFVPVEGRPADLMLTYFFKALFQPNQYLFQKQGGTNDLVTVNNTSIQRPVVNQTVAMATNQPFLSQQQNTLPSGMPMMPAIQQVPQQTMQQNRTTPSVNTQQMPPKGDSIQATPPIQNTETEKPSPTTQMQPGITLHPIQPTTPIVSPLDIASLQPATPPSAKTAPVVQQPVMQQQPLQPISKHPPAPAQIDPAAQQELQQTLAQKKQLEEQIEQLKKQLEQKTQPIPAEPSQAVTQIQQKTAVSPVIKTIPVAQKTTQAPMVSDFPNIIMGVVKDARGNVLPNILIEVKDSDDNPVRAFKTNQLGQFASATPLLNGTYTILFEDPAKKHTFDAVQIEVIGEIMQPVEVISHDEREDLRKELFGK